ncbi:MAG TPA: glycosyltransferase family 2 protein [Pirellulales bacterium]
MTAAIAKRPTVFIVTPVYNESAGLAAYERAVTETLLNRPEHDFRVVLVDDGSTDGSWAMIQGIAARDARFQGVRLSRNYGSHVALSAGIAHASGDAVAILACDLQDPPDVILEFLARWRQGAKIVWGKRRSRADGSWRVAASRIFEHLVRRYAMPRGSQFTTGSFLLMDRQVAACFRQYQEHNRITFALVAWTGFDQAVVPYDRQRRVAGQSGWKLHQMLKSAYDTFIGYCTLPIRIITLLGAAIFLLCIPLSAYFIGCWLLGNPQKGWTSLMLGVTFFFGLQFLLMGVLGEYLYRIYSEVLGRPLYFVSESTASQEPAIYDAA